MGFVRDFENVDEAFGSRDIQLSWVDVRYELEYGENEVGLKCGFFERGISSSDSIESWNIRCYGDAFGVADDGLFSVESMKSQTRGHEVKRLFWGSVGNGVSKIQDFCYYANTIFLVDLLLYPRNEKFFMVCFSFAEGPLAWALIVWHCSLVFSSLDKLVSVLIHLLPGLVFFTIRWWDPATCAAMHLEGSSARASWPYVESKTYLWTWLFVVPLVAYSLWQLLYFLIVNVLRRQRLLRDPEVMTSYRTLEEGAKSKQFVVALKRFAWGSKSIVYVNCSNSQIAQNSWMAANVDNPNVSSSQLILVYLSIGFSATFILLIRSLLTVGLGLEASRALFSQLLNSLFHAPMSFYDSTPLGRILSRLSSDPSIVDLDIPFSLVFACGATINAYSNLGILAAVTW
ncbi:putative xenobiotic-transporting ATPase [Rosa chinensis]|uniref:Glycerophosphocholine acyltransferase 1 n=1 Tax=Rosa chinensis TaxID=74649 RepID=A0A2P6S701_ROSCH|nr:putative xenobiotic-transporting ATPase [Rosa chinensis]